MNIRYKDCKEFSSQELQDLFLSVGWLSANYPEKLVVAMRNSGTVFSAWDGEKLIGLMNAIDDGIMAAYVHYLLVNPEYHSQGIGKELVSRIKDKYKEYLYLVLVSEEKKNIKFYEKFGFEIIDGATPMYIMTL